MASCPRFVEFASRSDTKKYLAEVSDEVRAGVRTRPAAVTPSILGRLALEVRSSRQALPFRRSTND